MSCVYLIFKNNRWKEVSFEEFLSYDGEKCEAPNHWRSILVGGMLIGYRFSK